MTVQMVFSDHTKLGALSPSPSAQARTLVAAGLVCKSRGDTAGALEAFEQAINCDPLCHEAFAAGGEIFLGLGQIMPAADCFGCAVRVCPQNASYKERFIEAVRHYEFTQPNEALEEVLLSCLQSHENLEYHELATLWYSALRVNKDFMELQKRAQSDFPRFFERLGAVNTAFLLRPLFLEGLKKLMICRLDFEAFMTALRRALLEDAPEKNLKLSDEERIALAVAVSQYCWNSEFVFAVTPGEQDMLERAKEDVSENPLALALVGCYMPLLSFKNEVEFYKSVRHEMLQELLQEQVYEPLELQQSAKTIPAIVPIDNEISQAVQAQYEVFPYPRWRSFHPHIRDEQTEGVLRNAQAHILVAGSGTGKEAIELGHVFADARVLAVDLSRASLAYGQRQAQKFGIGNVRFMHGDILGLGVLDEQFDYITSSGVLHHMEDPLQGWRVLTDLLKPGGLMRIALYSERAREGIVKAREAISKAGIPATREGIRQFRMQAEQLVGRKVSRYLAGFADYYYTSECCDLVFHVQEHRFTLALIRQHLDELGLEFVKFYLPASDIQRYQKTFRGADLSDLQNWEKYEERHPETFIGMYRFWCRKK